MSYFVLPIHILVFTHLSVSISGLITSVWEETTIDCA